MKGPRELDNVVIAHFMLLKNYHYPKLKLLSVSVESINEKNLDSWQVMGYTYIILHEYDKYDSYLKELKEDNRLSILDKYKEVLSLEDFKVYTF